MEEETKFEEAKKRMGRPPKAKETQVVAEGENVTVPASQFAALMERLEKLENPGIQSKAKRTDEHTARLKLWEDRLVVGIGTVKTNYREPNPDYRLEIDLVVQSVDGNREKISAPYKVFMEEGKPVMCNIIEDKREFKTEVKEYANKLHVGKSEVTGDITSSDMPTSTKIPMEVTRLVRSITLEVMEGEYEGQKVTFEDNEINAVNA